MSLATAALFATVCVVTARVGHAQEISKGLSIVTLGGSYVTSSGLWDTTAGDISLGYEGLLSDRIALALAGGWRRVDSGGFVESSAELSVTGAWYLTPRKAGSPYVAVRAGVTFADKNDSVFNNNNPPSLGTGIGFLQLFGSERFGAGVRLELTYAHHFCGEQIVDDMIFQSYSVNEIATTVGITFYFRQKR
jgi:hypothetical protein